VGALLCLGATASTAVADEQALDAGGECEADADCAAGLVCTASRRCLAPLSPVRADASQPDSEGADEPPAPTWSLQWRLGFQPYVLQALAADAAVVGIAALRAERDQDVTPTAEALMFTGPVVHLLNDEPLKASVSLTVRVVARLAAPGLLDCPDSERTCVRDRTLVAAAIGSAFDIGALGWWDSSIVSSRGTAGVEHDEFERYWAPVLGGDLALATLALAVDSSDLAFGLLVSGAGVHAVHGQWAAAGRSVLFRAMGVVGFAALGNAIGFGSSIDAPQESLGLIGGAIALGYDYYVLAKRPVLREGAALGQPRVLPWASVAGGGPTFGLVGSF